MTRWRLVLAVAALVPLEAAAYIDPGTGSLLVQGLIAGLAIAAATIRGYWYRIKAFFGRKPAAQPAVTEGKPAAEKNDAAAPAGTPAATESKPPHGPE